MKKKDYFNRHWMNRVRVKLLGKLRLTFAA